MAFVNEYISKEDMESFSIKKIDASIFRSGKTNSSSWTIDRERGIYLRCVTVGREEFSRESGWVFFWHGNLIWVELLIVGASSGDKNSPGWARRRVTRLCLVGDGRDHLPEALVSHREEILHDLYEALLAFKDGGVYSITTSYELFLEVAEGV